MLWTSEQPISVNLRELRSKPQFCLCASSRSIADGLRVQAKNPMCFDMLKNDITRRRQAKEEAGGFHFFEAASGYHSSVPFIVLMSSMNFCS